MQKEDEIYREAWQRVCPKQFPQWLQEGLWHSLNSLTFSFHVHPSPYCEDTQYEMDTLLQHSNKRSYIWCNSLIIECNGFFLVYLEIEQHWAICSLWILRQVGGTFINYLIHIFFFLLTASLTPKICFGTSVNSGIDASYQFLKLMINSIAVLTQPLIWQ